MIYATNFDIAGSETYAEITLQYVVINKITLINKFNVHSLKSGLQLRDTLRMCSLIYLFRAMHSTLGENVCTNTEYRESSRIQT